MEFAKFKFNDSLQSMHAINKIKKEKKKKANREGGIVAGLLSFHEYKTYTLRSLRIYYKYSELRLFTK